MRYKWDTLQREFTCCGGYGYTQVRTVLHAEYRTNIRIFWRNFVLAKICESLMSSKYLNKYGSFFTPKADKFWLFCKKFQLKSTFVNLKIFAIDSSDKEEWLKGKIFRTIIKSEAYRVCLLYKKGIFKDDQNLLKVLSFIQRRNVAGYSSLRKRYTFRRDTLTGSTPLWGAAEIRCQTPAACTRLMGAETTSSR